MNAASVNAMRVSKEGMETTLKVFQKKGSSNDEPFRVTEIKRGYLTGRT